MVALVLLDVLRSGDVGPNDCVCCDGGFPDGKGGADLGI